MQFHIGIHRLLALKFVLWLGGSLLYDPALWFKLVAFAASVYSSACSLNAVTLS